LPCTFTGAAYSNSFFKGLVGKWNLVTETTVADDYNSTFRYHYKWDIRLLKDGTLYTVITGRPDGKRSIGKGWLYKNGKTRGIAYVNGRKSDESKGQWKLKNGALALEARGRYGKSYSIIRKINRNKYVITGTSSDGSRSVDMMTRIR